MYLLLSCILRLVWHLTSEICLNICAGLRRPETDWALDRVIQSLPSNVILGTGDFTTNPGGPAEPILPLCIGDSLSGVLETLCKILMLYGNASRLVVCSTYTTVVY